MQRPCNLDWQGLICTEYEAWSTVLDDAHAAWYHGYLPPYVGRVSSIDASGVLLEANHGKLDENKP
jgi:hypothetical protein